MFSLIYSLSIKSLLNKLSYLHFSTIVFSEGKIIDYVEHLIAEHIINKAQKSWSKTLNPLKLKSISHFLLTLHFKQTFSSPLKHFIVKFPPLIV